jgi:hypothetical protein
MARILVNNTWVDVDDDLNGKSVANVIQPLLDDGELDSNVHEYGIKADGVVLVGGEVIDGQQVLEVIEVPQVSEDAGVEEDSVIENLDDADHSDDK